MKRTLLFAAGLLCSAVFAAASAQSSGNASSKDQKPEPSFNTLDKNHDGRITRSEVPRYMHALRRDFHRYDRDGNGSLSRQEYQAYLHKTVFRQLP